MELLEEYKREQHGQKKKRLPPYRNPSPSRRRPWSLGRLWIMSPPVSAIHSDPCPAQSTPSLCSSDSAPHLSLSTTSSSPSPLHRPTNRYSSLSRTTSLTLAQRPCSRFSVASASLSLRARTGNGSCLILMACQSRLTCRKFKPKLALLLIVLKIQTHKQPI